ncbi:hypothetical protein HGRIS_003039 [Hohenbuehelia grisea]|uniref:F-box domain-containing protein n=1 Tax=Hohenbuehelia grisea TaxID=104357 RepID=A0ABR3JMG5_9AGAR
MLSKNGTNQTFFPCHPDLEVPADVVAIIFEHYAKHYSLAYVYQTWSSERHAIARSSDKHDIASPYRLPATSVWTLGMVCRLWRDVAINTASIWSDVKVLLDWDDLDEKDGRSSEERVARVIAPLPDADQLDRWPLHPALQILAANSARWKNLKLYFKSGRLWHRDIKPLLDGNMPQLRSLHIDVTWMNQEMDLFSQFQYAPNLRHVRVLDYKNHDDPVLNVIPLPWHQIQTIGGAVIRSEGQLKAFLSASKTLEVVLCLNYCLPGRISESHNVHDFPVLRHLALHYSMKPLAIMTAPSLSTLRIDSSEAWDSTKDVLSPFIVRSRCPLRTLEISGQGLLHTPELIQLFEYTPDLEDLVIAPDISDLVALLERMTGTPESPPLLRRLQRVSISHGYKDYLLGLTALQAFIESRSSMAGGCLIRSNLVSIRIIPDWTLPYYFQAGYETATEEFVTRNKRLGFNIDWDVYPGSKTTL